MYASALRDRHPQYSAVSVLCKGSNGCPQVTRAGLLRLAGLQALTSLSVRFNEHVDGAVLTSLGSLPQLAVVDVSNCVNVDNTAVTDLARYSAFLAQ
jgi:hypothetical protein